MKNAFVLLLLAGYAVTASRAQTPVTSVRRDSLPRTGPVNLMPSVRPSNSFYRDKRDGPNVVRATQDNMPIKVPDTSIDYTIQQSKQRYQMPTPRPDSPAPAPRPGVPRKKE